MPERRRWLQCEICAYPPYGGGILLYMLEGVRLCHACFEALEPAPTIEDQRRRRLDLEKVA